MAWGLSLQSEGFFSNGNFAESHRLLLNLCPFPFTMLMLWEALCAVWLHVDESTPKDRYAQAPLYPGRSLFLHNFKHYMVLPFKFCEIGVLPSMKLYTSWEYFQLLRTECILQKG